MASLGGLAGALRWFEVDVSSEWVILTHSELGDRYAVHGRTLEALVADRATIEDAVLELLPGLCEQCGRRLTGPEDLLCRGCVDRNFGLLFGGG